MRSDAVVLTEPEGPVFALLSNPDEATVTWLMKRRRAGQAAIAFVLEPRLVLRDRLAAAGWQVVPVHDWTEPADAWQSAGLHTEVPA